VLVTRITRADGTVLFEHEHTQQKVLDATWRTRSPPSWSR
jgi:hypothetical protein